MAQFTNPYNGQNGYQSQMPNYNQTMPNMANNMAQQNWKPFTPGPQVPPLLGKWVHSFDEIKPMDVPMDGSICFFPQTDYTCLYAMQWSNDGKIMAYRFIPEKNETQPNQSQTTSQDMGQFVSSFETAMGALTDRVDGLYNRLDDIYDKVTSQPKNSTRGKSVKDGEQT